MHDRSIVLFANRNRTELLPDNDQYDNRFEIKSSSSTRLYTIARNKKTGEWSCSCPGWKMKKPGRDRKCQHLDSMMPVLRCIGFTPEKATKPARRIA